MTYNSCAQIPTDDLIAAGTEREPLIVDPCFRDQFEMAKATPSYMRFMDALPQVLVSTEPQLRQLVKILCREMHEAFVMHGASIPPWRGKESLLSKWRLPRLSHPDRPGSLHSREGSCTFVSSSTFVTWQPQPKSSTAAAVVVSSKGSSVQPGKVSVRGATVSRHPPVGVAAMQEFCGSQA